MTPEKSKAVVEVTHVESCWTPPKLWVREGHWLLRAPESLGWAHWLVSQLLNHAERCRKVADKLQHYPSARGRKKNSDNSVWGHPEHRNHLAQTILEQRDMGHAASVALFKVQDEFGAVASGAPLVMGVRASSLHLAVVIGTHKGLTTAFQALCQHIPEGADVHLDRWQLSNPCKLQEDFACLNERAFMDVHWGISSRRRTRLWPALEQEFFRAWKAMEARGIFRKPIEGPFIPTPLQSSILKALEGKTLKKDGLEDVCQIDGSRFYRPGGIKELMEIGKVMHKPGVGYYRPDALPGNAGQLQTGEPPTSP